MPKTRDSTIDEVMKEIETVVAAEIEGLLDRKQIIEIGSVIVAEIQTFHLEQNVIDAVPQKIPAALKIEHETETEVEAEIEGLLDRKQIIETGSVIVAEIQTFHLEQNVIDAMLQKIPADLKIGHEAENVVEIEMTDLVKMSQKELVIGTALDVVNPILQNEMSASIVVNQRELAVPRKEAITERIETLHNYIQQNIAEERGMKIEC